MMLYGNKSIFFLACITLLAAGCGRANNPPTDKQKPVACTDEAMLCPDGSSVGRTGPNCEFTACPVTPQPGSIQPLPIPLPLSQTSGIEGTVSIGPTCPVQRVPPDPNCADRPYAATIDVKTADGQKQIAQVVSGADGKFKASLAPGSYLLVVGSGKAFPRGDTQFVTVEKNKFTQVVFMLDSGIR